MVTANAVRLRVIANDIERFREAPDAAEAAVVKAQNQIPVRD